MQGALQQLAQLKHLAQEQKKALLAGSLDLFFSLEQKKDAVRKEIDQRVGQRQFAAADSKSCKQCLAQIIALEKENKQVLVSWLQNLKEEKNRLQIYKKVSSTYYNPNMVKEPAGYINKSL